MMATEYVCGFAFDSDEGGEDGVGRVALIRKNRPNWQAGKWNGIGGHVEPGEFSPAAMAREFREEAGVDVDGWEKFLTLRDAGGAWFVHFFRAFFPIYGKLESLTDEPVDLFWPSDLRNIDPVPNLFWLVPLAADRNWRRARGGALELVDGSGVEG